MPGKDWSVFPVGKPNDAYAKYFVGKSYLDMISKDVPAATVFLL